MGKQVKLLIKVDEDKYEIYKHWAKYGRANDAERFIVNGTLITDDAISRSKLRKQFEDRSLEDFTHLHFIDAIDNAPEFGEEDYGSEID